MLFFSDQSFNGVKITSTLTASIEYIISKGVLILTYFKIVNYLFVNMQYIFSFYQETALLFMLFSLY